jgi:hypothetical protein
MHNGSHFKFWRVLDLLNTIVKTTLFGVHFKTTHVNFVAIPRFLLNLWVDTKLITGSQGHSFDVVVSGSFQLLHGLCQLGVGSGSIDDFRSATVGHLSSIVDRLVSQARLEQRRLSVFPVPKNSKRKSAI